MNKHSIKCIGAMIFTATIACAGTVSAATIDILWYTGGVEANFSGQYQSSINNLAAQENSVFNVSGSVNTWNITYWASGAMPTGSFDVLVAASREGGWSSYPSYSALTSAVTASSFGDRVLITGQDADWHYINSPGSGSFNGPAGFLIDAINWAGSGTGMGGVFLSSGVEQTLFTGLGSNTFGSNTVNIPGAYASFPINSGLTSAGLSNWNTSAHDSYSGFDTNLWTDINVDPSGDAVTLVSKATAGGGTDGEVPEGGMTLVFLAGSMLGLGVLRRRLLD